MYPSRSSEPANALAESSSPLDEDSSPHASEMRTPHHGGPRANTPDGAARWPVEARRSMNSSETALADRVTLATKTMTLRPPTSPKCSTVNRA